MPAWELCQIVESKELLPEQRSSAMAVFFRPTGKRDRPLAPGEDVAEVIQQLLADGWELASTDYTRVPVDGTEIMASRLWFKRPFAGR